jgi:hypothetical protein
MSPYEYSCWSANNDALTQTLYFRHERSPPAGGSDAPAPPNDQLCAVQTGQPKDGVVAHNEILGALL